jgi:hypothetical protein
LTKAASASAEAERVARRRRTLGNQLRQQRQAEGGGVGHHVAGVGNQGQRVGDEAGDDFDDGEQQRQHQRAGQRLLAARFNEVRVLGVAGAVGVQVGGGGGGGFGVHGCEVYWIFRMSI